MLQARGFALHIPEGSVLGQYPGTIDAPSQKLHLCKILTILDLETGSIF